MNCRLFSSLFAFAFICASTLAQEEPRTTITKLKVSDNKRFVTTEDGKPFFWLGDTAWELFHRLNREEAILYLDNRQQHQFTVIQAVALAELDGLDTPNAYGHKPLDGNDPTKPLVAEGPDNDYWDHVDFIVRKANERGIYVGLLPTWGDKWNKKWGQGPVVFNRQNARVYGEWIASRYRDAGIIWILGGDRPIETDEHREIIVAMAEGIRQADQGNHLITFHPMGGSGSSQYFHDAPWLDFNMRQNGHNPEFTGRYESTFDDYQKTPTKPVLDGEPIYEDHPVSFDSNKFGHSIAADVRRPLYWNLFSGAFGHTYGHHSVWQMWSAGRDPINNPLMPWQQAINQTGARQMKHGRALIESRPFLDRIPDQSIIVADQVPTSVPGAGRYRFVATRDAAGTYAMIYVPVGRSFRINTRCIRDEVIKAWWFNPRDGKAQLIESFVNSGERTFVPPDLGEELDWVLVLDSESAKYPEPGKALP
jgi:hypothetical protein